MVEKKASPAKDKKTKKKPAGDFDNIAKHSTWNLLTGCYNPFVHQGNEDGQTSTATINKKDSKT